MENGENTFVQPTDEIIASEGEVIDVSGDDRTVAQRLREISQKKNEYKEKAERLEREIAELKSQNKGDGDEVLDKTQVASTHKETDYEEVFRADIESIREMFPEEKATHIRQLPQVEKFARLRDAGFSAVEAYRAVNADRLLERATSKPDTRTHLVSVGARSTVRDYEQIPSDELGIWKSAFPKLSEKELTSLYNKSK